MEARHVWACGRVVGPWDKIVHQLTTCQILNRRSMCYNSTRIFFFFFSCLDNAQVRWAFIAYLDVLVLSYHLDLIGLYTNTMYILVIIVNCTHKHHYDWTLRLWSLYYLICYLNGSWLFWWTKSECVLMLNNCEQ